MNLHQMLSRFSHDQLTKLSEEFGVVSMSPSTRNLLQDVRAKYRDVRFLARLISELPEAHRGFLQTVIFLVPFKNQTAEIPASLLNAWFGQDPHPLRLFFEKGLFFKKDEALMHTVIIPDDLFAELSRLLLPKPVKGLNEETADGSPLAGRIRMLELVFHLLCFLDRRKASLTQVGNIHRKVMEMFQKRLPSAVYTEDEFWFALNFCRHLHLLVEHNGALRTSSITGEWFENKLDTMLHSLWRFFLTEAVYPRRDLQQFLLFLRAQCLTKDGASFRCAYTACLKEFVNQINPALPDGSELHQSAQTWMRLLEFSGLIEFDSLDNPASFCMTYVGQRILMREEMVIQKVKKESGMLQPNFDWLIPPTAGYDELWKIDQIAEFEQRDVMTRFRLTQGSILHAMRKGWSQDEVISFILEHSQNRVPENVLYSVKEWCGKYGEIRLKKVLLLECQSKALAEELLQIEALQPWLGGRIGDCFFAVEENEMRGLSKTLQDLGYEPAVIKSSSMNEKN